MVSVDYLMLSGVVVSVSEGTIVLRGDDGKPDISIRYQEQQKPIPGDRVALTCQIDGYIDLALVQLAAHSSL